MKFTVTIPIVVDPTMPPDFFYLAAWRDHCRHGRKLENKPVPWSCGCYRIDLKQDSEISFNPTTKGLPS